MRSKRIGGWPGALGALLAVVSLSTTPHAGSGAVVRNPAPEPLEAELVKLGSLIANAAAKLHVGAVGVGTVETAPAQLCCAANLKRMWVRLEECETILEEFASCYDEERLYPMVTQVEIAKVDLEGISRTADAFAKAATVGDANGALDALTRAYLHFRQSVARLEPCRDVARREPSDGEAAGDTDGDGFRKAKKHRKSK